VAPELTTEEKWQCWYYIQRRNAISDTFYTVPCRNVWFMNGSQGSHRCIFHITFPLDGTCKVAPMHIMKAYRVSRWTAPFIFWCFADRASQYNLSN